MKDDDDHNQKIMDYFEWLESLSSADEDDLFLTMFEDIEPMPMYTNNVIDFQAYKDARK